MSNIAYLHRTAYISLASMQEGESTFNHWYKNETLSLAARRYAVLRLYRQTVKMLGYIPCYERDIWLFI